MRSPFRPLSLPLAAVTLASAAAGCTAIADPSSYHYDLGCDLTLRLTDFSVHAGSPLIVRVDSPGTADVNDSNRQRGVAILDRIPATTFSLDIPMGVVTEDSNLDFFADITAPFDVFNAQNEAMTGRGDHSWTIHRSCAASQNEFAHNLNFSDFPNTIGPGEDLQFQTSNLLAANANVEIRMTQYDPDLDAVDGSGDGRYTLVFYRRAADAADDFLTRLIPGMLDRGVASTVEVWVDRDGDQVVDDTSTGDATDEGYVFVVPAVASGSGPIVLDRLLVGTDDHSGAACVHVEP